jgi:uncharacterized protein YndB with AHSA1/START domain
MKGFVGAMALLLATPATAEVVHSKANGFELRYSTVVPSAPKPAMEAFARVNQWWDAAHTYSGKADNLSLQLKAGGCFCEHFADGGGVEHLHVTYVDLGKRLVMTGALGPLLYEATTGVMDVQFKPAGTGTEVILNYRVAGFANGGADKLAPLVDKVMGGMMARFAAYATPAKPAR